VAFEVKHRIAFLMAQGDRQVELRTARIAFIGAVLGATIGGLGSFAGAYFTYQTQADQKTVETRQAAFVKFLSEADKYRFALGEAGGAVNARDSARYVAARARLIELSSSLYAATFEADLASDNDDLIWDVTNRLFAPDEHPRVEQCNFRQFAEAYEDSQEAMIVFQEAAEREIRGRS
jgi:hypothetical protein